MGKTIFTKDPVKFIPALAETLKGMEEFVVPEWAAFVKSGTSRERPPVSDDFWYTRAASILRQLYIKGVVGVERLRTRYGSRKDRGGKANKFKKSGGKIIRVILQQAEAAGLVEKITRLQYGRRLTVKGRELLDSIEVEAKEGLNFEEVSTKPMGFISSGDDSGEPQDDTHEGVEEVVEEEGETKEENVEAVAPKGVPPAQMAYADADKVGKVESEELIVVPRQVPFAENRDIVESEIGDADSFVS